MGAKWMRSIGKDSEDMRSPLVRQGESSPCDHGGDLAVAYHQDIYSFAGNSGEALFFPWLYTPCGDRRI